MLNIFSLSAIIVLIVAVVLIAIYGKNTKKLKIKLCGLFNIELENYENKDVTIDTKKKKKAGASTPANSKKK